MLETPQDIPFLGGLIQREILYRLLVDAASAAFEVGYESASQFNREYSRLFGQPPMRDVRV